MVRALMILRETGRLRDQQTELRTAHEEARIERSNAPAEAEEAYIDPMSLINPDYLGWLTVYGTEVDYPVVLGEDNTYYLTHDFYGDVSSAGCLFADSACDRTTDGNLIIYGHHMKNGTMFGSLNRYNSMSFFQEHSLVRWETGGVGVYYEIFAVAVIPGYEDAADWFPLPSYANEIDGDKTMELVTELRTRSSLWREIDLDENDRFLFLVTCDYSRANGRMLLCAKRLGGVSAP